jgi:hypothetical protein
MKKNISLIFSIVAGLLILIGSCKKEDNIKQVQNDVLKRYLEIKAKMSAFQQNNGKDNLEAIGASIMNEMKKKLKSSSDFKDTVYIDSLYVDTTYWENWTCAIVSEYIDNDGNNVTVYDYGDEGCDEWGSLIKGKITYIWSQNNEKYFSKVLYENYNAYGMTMNGYSEYTYTFSTMDFPSDSNYVFNCSGSSSCVENIEMTTENENYLYTANCSYEWDENSCTVHVGETSYKELNLGYEYTYKVTNELYYNYSCRWEIYVPTRGIEEILYKSATEKTEFITDYGDGACDNLAIITENGIVYSVDFGDMWYWQNCEGGGCDSVVYVDVTN